MSVQIYHLINSNYRRLSYELRWSTDYEGKIQQPPPIQNSGNWQTAIGSRWKHESKLAPSRSVLTLCKVAGPSSFRAQWLTMIDLFSNASPLLPRREDWEPVLQVNSMVSWTLLQISWLLKCLRDRHCWKAPMNWVMACMQPSSECCVSWWSSEEPLSPWKGS